MMYFSGPSTVSLAMPRRLPSHIHGCVARRLRLPAQRVISTDALAAAAAAAAALPSLVHRGRRAFVGNARHLRIASRFQVCSRAVSAATLADSGLTSSLHGSTASSRLADLRRVLGQLGLDALIVPSDDPHLSEVPPACFARRAFVSGFTGSAGTAVVTATEARLWTDGRYFLQAERELPEGWKLMKAGLDGTPKVQDWLAAHLREGQKVGIDPAVHAASDAGDLHSTFAAKGLELCCLAQNPVDLVWSSERPPLPSAPVRVHPLSFAGVGVVDKLAAVRAEMQKKGASFLVVSALDEIAYLLNLRGGDVHCTPVVLAYVVVGLKSAVLFVDSAKFTSEIQQGLADAGVDLRPYEDALPTVAKLGCSGGGLGLSVEASSDEGLGKVWMHPGRTNYALRQAVGDQCSRVEEPSPIAEAKAIKNSAELEGMRAAHRRDGAALAGFFAWLERRCRVEAVKVTEVDVDEEVTRRRAAQWGYLENSFDTIAGYGANGAIIHYRASPATAAVLGTSSLFLLDSGGQYVDGTTDVTRTVHLGRPTPAEKECFTRVLKGHVALATAVFPPGTPGFVLDALARRPLWAAGLDYRHGTGHGVGAGLAVHEGPHGISTRYENKTPLKVGMIVSNEPGYYEDGKFGIRIENLLVIVERTTPHIFGGKSYLGFEPLTLVPIQRELVDVQLLTEEELAYINAYHVRVLKEIGPLLREGDAGAASGDALSWLQDATAPLERLLLQGVSPCAAAAAAAVGGQQSQL